MRIFPAKVHTWIERNNNNKTLGLLSLLLLLFAIPGTVYLQSQQRDIRQHADSYAAKLAVTSTQVTAGNTLEVNWKIDKDTFEIRNEVFSLVSNDPTRLTGGETIELMRFPCGDTPSCSGGTGVSAGFAIYLNCQVVSTTRAIPQEVALSGACPVVIPTTMEKGSYFFRMMSVDGKTLGASTTFTISQPLIPITRLIKTDNSMYFWATPDEKTTLLALRFGGQPVWKEEGITWYAYSTATPNTTPVYRLIKTDNSVYFLASEKVKTALLGLRFNGQPVWKDTGIIWYASTETATTIPITQLLKTDNSMYFWANPAEKDAYLALRFGGQPVWKVDGISFYAFSSPVAPTSTPAAINSYGSGSSVPYPTGSCTNNQCYNGNNIPDSPTNTPTPTPVPAYPTENPAYQYHYDPNNGGN